MIGYLNYSFECDWLIELFDNKLFNNKLSDNNLASELVKNRSFFKPITGNCNFYDYNNKIANNNNTNGNKMIMIYKIKKRMTKI